jgi:hypothetical protein
MIVGKKKIKSKKPIVKKIIQAKKVSTHLKKDIKEARKGISDDKKLMKGLKRSKSY